MNIHAFEFVLQCYKTHKMGDKAVVTHPSTTQFVSKWYKLNKYVIKQSIDVFLYFILFLTNVNLKKYMWHSCFYISVFKVYCPDKYKTQRICDEAIDHSPAALKLFLIGLLQVKWLKNVILFCTHMMVYPFLIKTMVISYFFVMKWLFLV